MASCLMHRRTEQNEKNNMEKNEKKHNIRFISYD